VIHRVPEPALLDFLHTQEEAAHRIAAERGFAGAVVTVLEDIGTALDCTYAGVWTRSPCGRRFDFLVGLSPAAPGAAHVRSATTSFARGEGLIGRAWQQAHACYSREREHASCELIAPRTNDAPAAVAVPIPVDGEIEAVLAFVACAVETSSAATLDALSSVGRALGRAFGRLPPEHTSMNATPVRDHVSDVERLEAQLREAMQNAETQAHRHLEFLAVLGHELRNPLAALVAASELLDLERPEMVERAQGVFQRQTKHLTRLVDDLLDATRASHGKLRVDLQPLDLSEAIDAALEMTEALFRERMHRLHLQVTRGLWVDGDRARLAQVFQNLLANASRYTLPGGNVWVSAQHQDDDCVVRVVDDGLGMKPEILDVVFEPFVQGTTSETRAGLGLGLALVKSLVGLHGGSVEAKSSGLRQGSQFTVRLPMKRVRGIRQ
jgi:signal transduction histidine kinase